MGDASQNPAVHQLVAGFARGDAISQEALILRDVLRGLGMTAEVFAPADRITADDSGECRSLESLRDFPVDVLIGHYSTSSPFEDVWLNSAARKVMLYHNITPADFYAPFDAVLAAQLRMAREHLPSIIRRVDAVWADSEFNAAELRQSGAGAVRVFPLLFDARRLDLSAGATCRGLKPDMTNILFVGRIAPNKCLEELIAAFACYHRNVDSRSRLAIVGSERAAPAYFMMLRMYAAELGVEEVCFERYVLPDELPSYYAAADLYVCTSRHEGYCLPLIEAMYKGVPVIARNTGGMPEAMGGAGVLFDELSATGLAALFERVLSDEVLRAEILASQRARIDAVVRRPVKDEVRALLEEALAKPHASNSQPREIQA